MLRYTHKHPPAGTKVLANDVKCKLLVYNAVVKHSLMKENHSIRDELLRLDLEKNLFGTRAFKLSHSNMMLCE